MKSWKLIAAAASCALLTSCSLLPEEATFQAAPLIRSYAAEEFVLAYAERGDMVLSTKISCAYVPVQTESLSYPVSGVYFDETFVQVGDNVVKGQLLAQLELDDIEAQLENVALQLEKLNIRMSALEENRALALERQKLQMKGAAASDLKEALDRVNESFDEQKNALLDQIEIAELQKNEYEEKIKARQLRAGIDGTVTYVRGTSSGGKSVKNERFISVADSTMSLFRAETEYWPLFEPGMECVVLSNKVEYEAVVASEAELGLPEKEKVEGESEYVYLKLKNPTFEISDGQRGTLTLVLDSRKDVLRVPESAIAQMNGQAIVYYQDDNGMKAYKPVETGLVAENMVEIISGLNEGESVIAE